MLNKKKLILHIIRVATAVLFVALVGILAILFFRTRMTTIGKTLQENNRIINALDHREEAFARLVAQFDEIQKNDSKIQNSFPYSDDILDVIGMIDSNAQKSGVIITKQFENPTPFSTLSDGTTIMAVSFSLSIQGSVASIRNFLKMTETMPYFISIPSITIRTSDDWNSPTTSVSTRGVLYTKERK